MAKLEEEFKWSSTSIDEREGISAAASRTSFIPAIVDNTLQGGSTFKKQTDTYINN